MITIPKICQFREQNIGLTLTCYFLSVLFFFIPLTSPASQNKTTYEKTKTTAGALDNKPVRYLSKLDGWVLETFSNTYIIAKNEQGRLFNVHWGPPLISVEQLDAGYFPEIFKLLIPFGQVKNINFD